MVVETDPGVSAAGVDTGFSPKPGLLRAPDVAVLPNGPDLPGWDKGVPPLAVEYADTGQDEAELQEKIRDLLQMGTRYIWVVRLDGLRRVEVYQPDAPMLICGVGDVLTAPGVLELPIPAEALFDPTAAHRVAFRNMLARYGYRSLDEVREEGVAEGREEGLAVGREEGRHEGEAEGLRAGLRAILGVRTLIPSDEQDRRIGKASLDELRRWLAQAGVAADVGSLLDG
jgi:hypothetical protein